MILTPFAHLGIPDQIGADDVVMMAILSPAEAGEVPLGPVGVGPQAGAIERTMIDPGHLELAV